MKLRSGRDALALGRASHTKVQNNLVHVTDGSRTIEFCTELQALVVKDGPTIATAVADVVTEVINVCHEGLKRSANGAKVLRVVHLVCGDGIRTSEDAMKRIQRYFTKAWTGGAIIYRLLVWRCAAHQTNLVVCIAVCGEFLGDPVEQNPLCGAAVRLYKYLIPAYCVEFASNLQAYIHRELQL
jgi:hypothetical protein